MADNQSGPQWEGNAEQLSASKLFDLLYQYHCAVSTLLNSCEEDSDNYISGQSELQVRDAWGKASEFFSLLPHKQ